MKLQVAIYKNRLALWGQNDKMLPQVITKMFGLRKQSVML